MAFTNMHYVVGAALLLNPYTLVICNDLLLVGGHECPQPRVAVVGVAQLLASSPYWVGGMM